MMEVKMRNEKGQFVKGFSTGFEDNLKLGHGWNKGTHFIHSGSFQKGHEVIGGFETRYKKGDGLGEHHTAEVIQKQSETKLRELNPNWNGGRKISYGYVLILKPEHPFNIAGYVREHRLVMEEFLGRYLTAEEVVHRENEIRDDATDGKHKAYHLKLKRLARLAMVG
jgi:hypothetical protein